MPISSSSDYFAPLLKIGLDEAEENLSPVPDLTEQEILAEIVPIVGKKLVYDRERPLEIDRVADMTIVTLPVIPNTRAWIPCVWIDNVAKKRFQLCWY